MKQTKIGIVSLLVIFFVMLTGCGKDNIQNVKSSYKPTAMATVVKGNTNAAQIQYRLAKQGKWRTQKAHSSAFVISVPRSQKTQTLYLKAGSAQTTTVIKKATPLMALTKFMMTYQFAIQQNPSALALRTDLAAKQDFSGVIAQKQGIQMRSVIEDGQVMGLSLIASNKLLKTTKGLNEFGSVLGTLAGVTGSDAKSVLKQFAKSTKSVKDGKTTIDTITSKNINFDVAFSQNDVFIYVTHG